MEVKKKLHKSVEATKHKDRQMSTVSESYQDLTFYKESLIPEVVSDVIEVVNWLNEVLLITQ